ncbi:molecular chaperone DnaK [Algoriphagus namhaensis]
MKISKKDFEGMKAKYDEEVKKGKPAKGVNGDRKDQTSWIFFDRETLEHLLAQADKDPKVGGIQFFFTEYTEETAKKFHPEDVEGYTGQLTLVLKAANFTENELTSVEAEDEDGGYQNNGTQCPPRCPPPPTES